MDEGLGSRSWPGSGSGIFGDFELWIKDFGVGFRIGDLGFGVGFWELDFEDLGIGNQGFWIWILALGFGTRVWNFRLWNWWTREPGIHIWLWNLGFRSGIGICILDLGNGGLPVFGNQDFIYGVWNMSFGLKQKICNWIWIWIWMWIWNLIGYWFWSGSFANSFSSGIWLGQKWGWIRVGLD